MLKPPIKTLIRANTHEGNVGEVDELKAAVLARAEEAGTELDFYVAALVDVSPAEEENSPMAEYAFHGIEVALRPESRHVIVGKDHACVGQNLWMVAIDDKGFLYKCGGKLCGQPEYSYGTAQDWNPADPLATASNPDMLSKFLNTVVPSSDDKCKSVSGCLCVGVVVHSCACSANLSARRTATIPRRLCWRCMPGLATDKGCRQKAARLVPYVAGGKRTGASGRIAAV